MPRYWTVASNTGGIHANICNLNFNVILQQLSTVAAGLRSSYTLAALPDDPTDDEPLAPEHGGPARLLVPHLYFWKSAKWVRGFRLLEEDVPGFWESLGYHAYGDPWREQRYWDD